MKSHPATHWTILLLTLAQSALLAQADLSIFEAMRARSIGPAAMSGRISAVDALIADPDVIVIGAAAGGVWKSINGAITWEPLFDQQPVASIGAVAIDQSNPDVIWAGTGEGNPRNSVSVGNGVYKSLDGGRSWQHLGLEKSEHIHRILIHPRNPQVVYVAALGPLWRDGEQRGVFKTIDGGKSWEKVLSANPRTGAAELVMDPANPDKLIAALWEHRRTPWGFQSGGPGSGLFLTFDGGGSWQRLGSQEGLPEGDLGRCGLAFAASRPQVAYALVEAKKSGLYRTDDGGLNWSLISDERGVNPRPFYYADIRVDPQNENRLYRLHSRLEVSEDAGRSFRSVVSSREIHGDVHSLWIHPQDSDFLIVSNDGGMGISRDRGEHWRFVENLPLAQFYHVAVDMEQPYNIYGGLQDNGSWRGPSRVWSERGIFNSYWNRVGAGDGFDTRPDPRQPSRYGYAMSQGGNLFRFDLLTGERHDIRPSHVDDVPLRFNWNAALAIDPFEPDTIYYGSQFVHRSRDRGQSWRTVSPDLTSNDPEKQKQMDSGGLTYDVTAAENHTTLVVIAPSPIQQGVLWTGSDDGRIHVSRNPGAKWEDASSDIAGLPEGIWVNHIEPSPHDPASAFAVFDDHRRGDWRVYAYKTEDFGESWSRLNTESVEGYALVIRQDPVQPRLLFLGTEFGLYVSLDGGASWAKWTHGVPTTSVMDLVIHPRDHDLVIGTHGRALFVLDDIRPLRPLAEAGSEVLDSPLEILSASDAVQAVRREPDGIRGPGHAIFQGENRPYGAMLTYWVGSLPEPGADSDPEQDSPKKNGLSIEVLDSQGERIRTFEGPSEEGIRRVFWNLRRRGVRSPNTPHPGPDATEPEGREVLPGSYRIRIRRGEEERSAEIQVLADPRQAISDADRSAKAEMIDTVQAHIARLTESADRLREARQSVQRVNQRLQDREDEAAQDLRRLGRQASQSAQKLLDSIIGERVQGIRSNPRLPAARLSSLNRSLQSSWRAPTQSQSLALQHAERHNEEAIEQVHSFFQTEWAKYTQQVEAAGVTWIE